MAENITSKNILYGVKLSPYVRSVMMAFEEKGVDYHLTPPGGTVEALQSPEYRKIHPFGRVPALQNDEVTLFETLAICRYVDEAFDGPALQPQGAAQRAIAEQWSCALACYVLAQAINGYAIHYARAMRAGTAPDRAIIDAAVPKIAAHMDILDTRLGAVPYLAGEAVTIPDLMLAPTFQVLQQMPEADEFLPGRTHLAAWFERMKTRPSYITVNEKRAP